MEQTIDIWRIRRLLEARFGLGLTAEIAEVDGGKFPVLRPRDLEVGNGFSVVVSRTHRQVEASFRADDFSGGLLRRMGDCDEQSRRTFQSIRDQSRRDGAIVQLAVNGTDAEIMPGSSPAWRTLELTVMCRLGAEGKNASGLTEKGLEAASICLALALSLLPVEEVKGEVVLVGFPEGARLRVEVNRYERSPANRAACLSHFGARCQACGFVFSERYGERGEGYIEVHHRVPVSKMGPDYYVDPIRDLIPLCSNCHAMIHRTGEPLEIEQLQALLRR